MAHTVFTSYVNDSAKVHAIANLHDKAHEGSRYENFGVSKNCAGPKRKPASGIL